MEAIDQIRVNFNPEQLFILNICLGFLMFGVALDLKIKHFKTIIQQPKASFVGLCSQLVLLPILTVALVYIFQPPGTVSLGMILIASCPGGNVSNYAVHLAGGNTALSILLTSISTLAAVGLTPLYFTYLAYLLPNFGGTNYEIQLNIGDMMMTIVQLIIIPLILGMLLNTRYPKFSKMIHRPVKSLSMVIFLAFVVAAIYSNFDNIINYVHLVFFIVLVHNTLALLTGYGFAKLNKLSDADARAISIETGIQNSGLGLIIIFNHFDGIGGMAMIAAWWSVWHLIASFSLANWWKRKKMDPQTLIADH